MIPIENFIYQSEEPKIPTVGDVYFNTDIQETIVYDGTVWLTLADNAKTNHNSQWIYDKNVVICKVDPKWWDNNKDTVNLWLHENDVGEYSVIISAIIFSSPDKATFFKMKWGI